VELCQTCAEARGSEVRSHPVLRCPMLRHAVQCCACWLQCVMMNPYYPILSYFVLFCPVLLSSDLLYCVTFRSLLLLIFCQVRSIMISFCCDVVVVCGSGDNNDDFTEVLLRLWDYSLPLFCVILRSKKVFSCIHDLYHVTSMLL
jgi:hypothetical protein